MKVVTVCLVLALVVGAHGQVDPTSRPQCSSPPFDSDPLLIDTSLVPMPVAGTQTTPRAASDGINYLVVWTGTWYGREDSVVATRLSQTGVILDLGGICIGKGEAPAVAFDGINHMVVWSQDSFIRCARVSRAGVVLDTPLTVTNVRGAAPAVAFDGANFLVAWGGLDLYAARITPAGVILDTGGILVSGAPGVQEFPTIAFDGTTEFHISKGTTLYFHGKSDARMQDQRSCCDCRSRWSGGWRSSLR